MEPRQGRCMATRPKKSAPSLAQGARPRERSRARATGQTRRRGGRKRPQKRPPPPGGGPTERNPTEPRQGRGGDPKKARPQPHTPGHEDQRGTPQSHVPDAREGATERRSRNPPHHANGPQGSHDDRSHGADRRRIDRATARRSRNAAHRANGPQGSHDGPEQCGGGGGRPGSRPDGRRGADPASNRPRAARIQAPPGQRTRGAAHRATQGADRGRRNPEHTADAPQAAPPKGPTRNQAPLRPEDQRGRPQSHPGAGQGQGRGGRARTGPPPQGGEGTSPAPTTRPGRATTHTPSQGRRQGTTAV